MDTFQQQFNKAIEEYAQQNQYGVSKIPAHNHDGAGSLPIDPRNIILTPTVLVTTALTAPTDLAPNGTTRIQYDATHWYLWVRVAGLWKKVQLT